MVAAASGVLSNDTDADTSMAYTNTDSNGLSASDQRPKNRPFYYVGSDVGLVI